MLGTWLGGTVETVPDLESVTKRVMSVFNNIRYHRAYRSAKLEPVTAASPGDKHTFPSRYSVYYEVIVRSDSVQARAALHDCAMGHLRNPIAKKGKRLFSEHLGPCPVYIRVYHVAQGFLRDLDITLAQ